MERAPDKRDVEGRTTVPDSILPSRCSMRVGVPGENLGGGIWDDRTVSVFKMVSKKRSSKEISSPTDTDIRILQDTLILLELRDG
jgi:hypothetical protein